MEGFTIPLLVILPGCTTFYRDLVCPLRWVPSLRRLVKEPVFPLVLDAGLGLI